MRHTILNRSGCTSLFKRGLHEVILGQGNKLVLGYGYLTQNVITEIIDDDREDHDRDSTFTRVLKKWIDSDNKSEKEIIIIGNNEEDYSDYIKVAKYMNDTFSNLKIKVIIKDKNRGGYRQYHKKLAIKFTEFKGNLKPSIALIGSSNLSRSTYVDKDYSQEVDILLWNRFVLENDTEDIKYARKKELEMLKRIGKHSNYINMYDGLLDLIDSAGIDFGLELQLEDIIYEIENYRDCDFSLKYVNERNYSDVSIDELRNIIQSSETDEHILGEDLMKEVIKGCILCFYKYAQHNLDKENNSCYFKNQYNTFKRLIDGKTKEEIVALLEDEGSHYRYFKNRTFRNTINNITVYEKLMGILEVALNV